MLPVRAECFLGYVIACITVWVGEDVLTIYLGIGTEFDLVRADIILSNPYNTGSTPFVIERDWVPHWFVGATYYPRDQGVFAGIYYNLLDDGRSFYSNPEIRFGFFF